MGLIFSSFIHVFLKLFFILTPFFVLSTFLVMTNDFSETERKKTAVKVTFAVLLITFTMYLFGKYIFMVFGITIDAFRIGAGVLLFLSSVSLVQGKTISQSNQKEDIAVVPLALPVTVGPGTIGILLVMAAENKSLTLKLIDCAGLFFAVIAIGILLLSSVKIEKIIGQRGLAILSKITGLFIASISAQLIFTGIKNFLFN
ncbi:MarC family protein [Deferribacterales bacterium Es71-Z0220]|uniref:MarC family protein n=1 Tax=Deferrivibrio essentukiensis TaxID=2880922 RepID=UPI001F602A36|nr:MarC family protein [Deferrivibrio essentukiensis]MCB4203626.1 MarC family protein [Deferrivibrio essentukiensis]